MNIEGVEKVLVDALEREHLTDTLAPNGVDIFSAEESSSSVSCSPMLAWKTQ